MARTRKGKVVSRGVGEIVVCVPPNWDPDRQKAFATKMIAPGAGLRWAEEATALCPHKADRRHIVFRLRAKIPDAPSLPIVPGVSKYLGV